MNFLDWLSTLIAYLLFAIISRLVVKALKFLFTADSDIEVGLNGWYVLDWVLYLSMVFFFNP